MNAIETMNHLGTRFLDFALPMLIQSSVLIVALALTERIQRLLNHPRPKSARLNFAGLLFVILGGALLLPMAHGQRQAPGRVADGTTDPTDPVKTVSPDAPVAATSKDELAKAENTNQVVMIEAKFIALPHRAGAEKNNAPSDPALVTSKGENPSPFLDGEGLKAVLAAYAAQDIQPFAAPRVTVFTGREAELSVSQPAVQDGKAVLVGAALAVAPNVKGDSCGLQLRLRMGNLSESTNPSAAYPPADLFDPSSRFVLSTNITVPLGKTAILGRHVAEDNAGTNYVIFVTPKLVAPDNVPSKP